MPLEQFFSGSPALEFPPPMPPIPKNTRTELQSGLGNFHSSLVLLPVLHWLQVREKFTELLPLPTFPIEFPQE